jgi:hypothetical protein
MKISAADKVRRNRRIVAEDEFVDDVVVDEKVEDVEEVAEVEVEPEAYGLLFEAEDVAELVAEITETPVEVTVDDDAVKFTVGEDEFTVTPEGDEEILEAVRRPLRNKRAVKASAIRRTPRSARPIKAGERPARAARPSGRPIRREVSRKPAEAACGTKKPVKSSKTIKKFPTKK